MRCHPPAHAAARLRPRKLSPPVSGRRAVNEREKAGRQFRRCNAGTLQVLDTRSVRVFLRPCVQMMLSQLEG